MPVHGLKPALQSHALIKRAPLSRLANTRIAVEGGAWIRSLPSQQQEDFLAATGGAPLTLERAVDAELAAYAKANVQPLFVFGGATMPSHPRPAVEGDISHARRVSGWEKYNQHETQDAGKAFVESDKFPALRYLHVVFARLAAANADFLRAPALALAQIAWFCDQRHACAHWAQGPLELLLFGCARVITAVDWEKSEFAYVDVNDVLRHYDVTLLQFAEACVLSGYECRPLLPLIGRGGGSFDDVVADVKKHGSGAAVVVACEQHHHKLTVMEYKKMYMAATTLLLFVPVLCPNGNLQPLRGEYIDVPLNLSTVVGPRLPSDFYFLTATAAVGVDGVIGAVISGGVWEYAPLVDSKEYRSVIQEYMKLRSLSLHVLTSSLHDSLRTKKVEFHCYCGDGGAGAGAGGGAGGGGAGAATVATLSHATIVDVGAGADRASVVDATLTAEMAATTTTTINMVSLASLLQQQRKFAAARISSNSGMKTEKEVSASVQLAFLVRRDFVTQDYLLTTYGHAVAAGVPRFAQHHVVFAELLRLGVIGNTPLQLLPALPHTPYPHVDDVTLLSRVFALLPMRTRGEPWEGPLDQELAAFSSINYYVTRALRELVECDLAALILKHQARVRGAALHALSSSLPFFVDGGNCMGVACKHFLLQPRRVDVAVGFGRNCIDTLWDDIKDGIEFWRGCHAMVKVLAEKGAVDGAVLAMFDKAEAFLASKIDDDWDGMVARVKAEALAEMQDE